MVHPSVSESKKENMMNNEKILDRPIVSLVVENLVLFKKQIYPKTFEKGGKISDFFFSFFLNLESVTCFTSLKNKLILISRLLLI